MAKGAAFFLLASYTGSREENASNPKHASMESFE
jgi:hypothetical protein